MSCIRKPIQKLRGSNANYIKIVYFTSDNKFKIRLLFIDAPKNRLLEAIKRSFKKEAVIKSPQTPAVSALQLLDGESRDYKFQLLTILFCYRLTDTVSSTV
jgi:hypothetical protein